jgi:hypothetical protein
MPTDQTGAKEAKVAAFSFALLFLCTFGLLAASELQERGRTEAAATIATNVAFRLSASELRLTTFTE